MNENEIFNESNLTNPTFTYFKFEKIGDKVAGTLYAMPVKDVPDTKHGGESTEFLLKKADGTYVKVSLKQGKSRQFVLDSLKDALPGDGIGFEFTESIDTGKGNPAKIIKSYWKQSEANTPVVEEAETAAPVVETPVAEAVPATAEVAAEPQPEAPAAAVAPTPVA